MTNEQVNWSHEHNRVPYSLQKELNCVDGFIIDPDPIDVDRLYSACIRPYICWILRLKDLTEVDRALTNRSWNHMYVVARI